MHRKSVLGVLATGAAALIIAGCGAPSTGTAPASPAPASAAASSEYNAADVAFVRGMIPHHEQAVEMARLAAAHAKNGEVKQLATRIQGAQDPEIVQLKDFLSAWGAPAADPTGAMPGMDHATTGMPGMMSDSDMTRLGGSTGAAFDQLFLTLMTAHHQGAITMARTELAQGSNPQAKALARSIVTAQQGEITEMGKLRASS